ncbi:hypothetical protein LT493_44140 [Streptomyces tricolor]|nr:hypothetical protein [Streptomyces tricolor]
MSGSSDLLPCGGSRAVPSTRPDDRAAARCEHLVPPPPWTTAHGVLSPAPWSAGTHRRPRPGAPACAHRRRLLPAGGGAWPTP